MALEFAGSSQGTGVLYPGQRRAGTQGKRYWECSKQGQRRAGGRVQHSSAAPDEPRRMSCFCCSNDGVYGVPRITPRVRHACHIRSCFQRTGPAATTALCTSPLPHLRRDSARPCHICAGTRPAPATSAPGLGSPLWHICAGTRPAPATSAPGLLEGSRTKRSCMSSAAASCCWDLIPASASHRARRSNSTCGRSPTVAEAALSSRPLGSLHPWAGWHTNAAWDDHAAWDSRRDGYPVRTYYD